MSDEKKTQELSDDDFILEARLHPSQEPVAANVVSDSRSHFGKRLGILGLALLLLFFSINGYIQAEQNGRGLRMARTERGELIQTVENLSRVTNDQNAYILKLQRAIREQNELLSDFGIPTVPVPEPRLDEKDISDADSRRVPQEQAAGGSPNSEPRTSPGSDPKRDSRDRDDRDPQPRPPRDPDPPKEPDPPEDRPVRDAIRDVRDTTCELTGICP